VLWPDGARAAVSLTIDNLGEAAELELGLHDRDAPRGNHYSVTNALPIMLAELAAADISATFFIEGINTVIYPEALAAISGAGHEIGYHAWCHEDWSSLGAESESANLDRGLRAFRAAGIEAVGFRPPGGRLTPRTLELLEGRGLRYCSPAGSSAGIDRVAVIPFAWPAVDVFHVLPAFAALREHLGADSEPGGADSIRAAMLESIENALAGGAHTTLVLHTWMIELALDAVRDVLGRIGELAEAGELWAAPCRDVAVWMVERDHGFDVSPQLDETSWTAPS